MNEINLSRVNLNLLVLFDTIYEERHLARAAERLVLTPSAISHGLRRLRTMFDDPLFIRNPKGVTPTDRAQELAEPIAAVLAQVRGVLTATTPFDPLTSKRHFTLGAPDAVAAVILPQLLAGLRTQAPGIQVSFRELLPSPAERDPHQAWRDALSELDVRSLDVALIPAVEVPARFHARLVYDDDFVIVLRNGHPLAERLDFASYCAAMHLIVSRSGDRTGFVDQVIEQAGGSREVILTVPNFFIALSVVAESELLAAVPRSFARQHAARFALSVMEPPLPMGRSPILAVSPAAAMADPGLAWLHERLGSLDR